jgi:hypothetical protein
MAIALRALVPDKMESDPVLHRRYGIFFITLIASSRPSPVARTRTGCPYGEGAIFAVWPAFLNQPYDLVSTSSTVAHCFGWSCVIELIALDPSQ